MFQGNNRIRRKGFVRKTSSVASHQTSWYNKRMLRKTFWAPRDSSLIENYKLTSLDKGVATRGAKKAMSSPPPNPTSIFQPSKVQQLYFQTSEILLFWVFRDLTNQEFHYFYCVCYNFWTIYGNFLFFSKYLGKIDPFTLDLLKSSGWTNQKVSYCGPSKGRPQWMRV